MLPARKAIAFCPKEAWWWAAMAVRSTVAYLEGMVREPRDMAWPLFT